MGLVATGSVRCNDPFTYELASRPWEILSAPLKNGSFGNRKDYLVTPSVIVYRETFTTATRVCGMTPPGMLALALPLRFGARTKYWAATPTRDSVPATLPGALDLVVDAAQEHLVVLIAVDFLRSQLPGETERALERSMSSRSLDMPAQNAALLCRWLLGFIANAGQQPESRGLVVLARELEQQLPWRLASACVLEKRRSGRPQLSLRRRALDDSIEFLRNTDIASVSISELCRVAGVKPRTLEYGFREGLGMGPLRFIRLWRLHAAQRALAAAERGGTTVCDIAYRLGLTHHGRFSAEYRALFGELPSETLAKPPVDVETPLLLSHAPRGPRIEAT